jgi:hypothetical protein
MMSNKWAVVVPTNRPLRFVTFLESWTPLFRKHDVLLIVVQDLDADDGLIKEACKQSELNVELLRRSAVEMAAIPFGTDMIRSMGFFYAYQMGTTYTLSLDDDVKPGMLTDIFVEYEKVFDEGAVVSPFLSVGAWTNSPYEMRGFPFKDRNRQKVMVQYGGWHGVHDLDALTQIWAEPLVGTFDHFVLPVPKGVPATTCAMNFAFRTESTVVMWQFPLYEGRYNRMGDMWSGLVQKRVCDVKNQAMVINGRADVLHTRASDPVENLKKERISFAFSDDIWDMTKTILSPRGSDVTNWHNVVGTLAYNFLKIDPDYSQHLLKAATEWWGLFR